MTSKLKFYIDKKAVKTYTLKPEVAGTPTQDAHYKFLKLRDAPKS